MTKSTILIGGTLSMVGSGMFALTGALANLGTAAFGLALLGCGLAMRAPSRTALWGHLAMVLTTLGMLFSAPSIPRLLVFLKQEQPTADNGVISISVLGVLSLLHVTLGVRWFLRRRQWQKS